MSFLNLNEVDKLSRLSDQNYKYGSIITNKKGNKIIAKGYNHHRTCYRTPNGKREYCTDFHAEQAVLNCLLATCFKTRQSTKWRVL